MHADDSSDGASRPSSDDPTFPSGGLPPGQAPSSPLGSGTPTQIGRYRIVGVLGQGGMGTVYEAEQERPRRTVALKVVRAGSANRAALRRFEMEAEVLGLLQHPGIAQIYEAGTADLGAGPQPFFAMELVRGPALLRYADQHTLGTRQRLALMARICDAVQHAHQKGIIHRDLKPANILVDDTGQPKILDFGVARTVDADVQATLQTDVGQLVGTLPYMSPEQVAADPQELDTRSDVYALGVVLYELLAGRLPYSIDRKLIHEAVRVIREDDPTPLSTVDRVFRGDIETIAGKALAKERERRYQTAAELAADIQHYLDHEPIAARPPSSAYQLRKFARRNRALVTGVIATFAALLTGGVAATWQAVRATRAERQATASALQATREADKARAVNDFLQEMLAAADPANSLGRELTVRQMIDEAAQKVAAGGLSGQPELAATARLTLCETYSALGQYETSSHHARTAVALRDSVLGPRHPETAVARTYLAEALTFMGQYDQADSQATLAVDALRAASDHPEALAEALGAKASLFYNRGNFADGERLQREALQLARGLPGDHRKTVLDRQRALAFTLARMGKLDESESLAREALASARELFGSVHPSIVTCLVQLADVLADKEQVPAAREVLEEAETIARRIHPGDHPQRANLAVRRGTLATTMRDLDGAEGPLREALGMRRRILGPVHKDVAFAMAALANVYSLRGDMDAAERLHRETLAMREQVFGPVNPAVTSSRVDVAMALKGKGDLDAAETMLRRAIAEWRQLPGNERAGLVPTMHGLALVLQQKGDLDGAERQFAEALELCRQMFGEGDPETAQAMDNLGSLLFRKQEKARAAELMQASLALRRKLLAPGSPGLLVGMGNVAYVLEDQGRFAEAEPLYREYVQSAMVELPPDHATVEQGSIMLAANLIKQSKWVDAETAARERMAACDKTHPKGCPSCAMLRLRLGTALAGAKRFQEALAALTDSWTRMDADPKTAPTRKRAVAEQLLAVSEALGNADDMITWRDRLAALQKAISGG